MSFWITAFLFALFTSSVITFPLWREKLHKASITIEPKMHLPEAANSRPSSFAIISGKLQRPEILALILTTMLTSSAMALYYETGSPYYPDKPLAQKLEMTRQQKKTYQEKTKEVEAQIKAQPEEVYNWVILGQLSFRLGEYNKAAEAFRTAINKGVKEAEVYTLLGESIVMERDGLIIAEAQRAFSSALLYDNKDAKAMYYIALSRMQKDDCPGAIAIWKHILTITPENSPIHSTVSSRIKDVEALAGIKAASIQPRDPAAVIRRIIN